MSSLKVRIALLTLLVALATVAASAATGGPVAGVLGLGTDNADAAKSVPCKKAIKVVKKKCKKGTYGTKACKNAKKAQKKKCKKVVPKGPTVQVGVNDDYYGPSNVSIKSGSSVNWVWNNMNLNSHDVVLLTGPKGISIRDFSTPGTYAINAKFKRQFITPGTYRFHCTIHSTIMQMKVTVTK